MNFLKNQKSKRIIGVTTKPAGNIGFGVIGAGRFSI